MARSWLTTQSKPSFKGIPFEVEKDHDSGGRHVVVHEYPNSEFWDNEELGRKAFVIDVEAYVCGDDADQQAINLKAACDSPGTGLLILPNRPQQTVQCLDCVTIWDETEQGKFRVTMKFSPESRQKGGDVSAVELANKVAIDSDAACDLLVDDFTTNFNSVARSFGESIVVSVPSAARLAAGVSLSLVATAMQRLLGSLSISNSLQAAQAAFGVRQIRENAVTYAQQGESPYRIDSQVFIDDQSDTASAAGRIISDTMKRVADNADDPKVLAGALSELMTIQPQLLVTSSVNAITVKAETELSNEVMAFVRRIAIVRYAQALTRSSFTSRAEAVTAKAKIGPAFSPEIDGAQNPEVASALQGIARSAANYIAKNGALLPRIIKVDTARGNPAAVLATWLYKDAGRDEDLWRRNGIENHPLMMPTSIEALAPDGF